MSEKSAPFHEAIRAVTQRLDDLMRTYEIVVSSAMGSHYAHEIELALGEIKKRMIECENALKFLKPDLVIFGLGINDAYKPENQFDGAVYEANYDTLVMRIKEANPDCAFIFMTNNDSYYKQRYSNPNILKVQKAMRNLAKKHNKPTNDNPGGINEISQPIHLSNLMLADPKSGEPTRIGRKLVDGKLERYSKKSGEIIK